MKCKRFLSLLLALVLLVGFVPVEASAATSGICGDSVTWSVTTDEYGDNVLTISGTGPMYDKEREDSGPYPRCEHIIIEPGVTHIGAWAFDEYSGYIRLETVTIADTVTSIGDYAFYSCDDLYEIKMSGNVKTIGDHAFDQCGIQHITLPDTLTYIGDYAFSNNGIRGTSWSNSNITIPDSVTYLGNYAFMSNGLTSVTIPTSITTLNDGVFASNHLSSITIPNSVTSIGDGAFSDNDLTSITVPDSVTSIGNRAFAYNDDLKSVKLPNNLTSIPAGLFYDCDALTSYTVPDGITKIGEYAFYECGALTSVTLPNTLVTIDQYAFYHSALNDISIPSNVVRIGDHAFRECVNLKRISIPDSVISIGDCAFSGSGLTQVTLPSNLTWISRKAFQNCSDLEQIYIPVSVTDIDIDAFKDCKNLTFVYYGGSAAQWKKINIHEEGNGDLTGAAIFYNVAGPAKITQQPEDVTVASGEKATVKVEAEGEDLAYTWYVKDSGDTAFKKSSVTTSTYSVTMSSEVKDRQVYCVVTDSKGNSVTSNTVTMKMESITAPKVTAKNTASSGKTKLSWKAVDGAEEYIVYRASSKDGKYSKLKTTTATSYTDSSAKVGTTYYYKVKAVGASSSNTATSSAVKGVRDLPYPTVTAKNTASSGKTKLSWKAIDGAEKYVVYRATSKDGKYTELKTTTATSYTDSSAKVGKTYYYKVVAVHKKSAANSAKSAAVSAVRDLAQPTVSVTVKSNGDPKVSWKEVSGATKYYVYRATSKSGEYTKVKSTTKLSFTDTTAKAGKTYYYKVRAIHSSSAANSAYSALVKAKAK